MVQVANVGKDKASFDHVYDRPDPREYFRVLGSLDYEIPQQAHPVFAALVDARNHRMEATADGDSGSILDVCCSYGVNAALLRCELTMSDLEQRYREPSLADLSPDELAASDRSFYAKHQRSQVPRIAGLDSSLNAVTYGCQAGLLDAGVAENLETQEPSPQLAETLADVGMVTTTGGVGYITHRTFDGILGNIPSDRRPWVAAFVLRMFTYDHIAETLERHGLVTEQLSDVTFPQRRFASEREQESTINTVRALGIDTSDKEDLGCYHASFYLSRPAEDVAAEPLDGLLNGLTFAA